ncbi:MAG TPA: acetamidase/formamidase family protein [Nitrolancea sp.]|jgi:acetamidase/formamidase|nr:acetamidase/formamidase family protein [Nitrolancea sp.]
MATFSLEPVEGTLHGSFSADYPPVLTIDSGDRVVFRTLDVGWNLVPLTEDPATHKKFSPRVPGRDNGHAICGPVAVRGAEPGMTLEIEIISIEPGSWGWNRAGGTPSPLNRRLGVADSGQTLVWTIDRERGMARSQIGFEVPISPFMGVMGMPPAESGIHPTPPPRNTGGNIDCKELLPGSSLFLPIAVAGGLFSTGDGHARQGDGEVSGTGIECPIDRVELAFTLHKDLTIETPRADTAVGWITFGFDEDLDEAMAIALSAMLDLMGEQYGLSRSDALGVASAAVDLHVTQVVNGVSGVHAILPHGLVRATS